MAYMSQERKKALAPAIMAICKKHGLKASLAVRHHSTLVLNIASGPIYFLTQYNERTIARLTEQDRMSDYSPVTHIDVNEYHLEAWTGPAGEFLREVMPAMMTGNHDRSDTMTDYFDVGWYIDINVGQWDKPYICTAPVVEPVAQVAVLEIDTPPVAGGAAVLQIDTPDDWQPQFSKWRHGGWYVDNVRYPSGACGCVSNNYDDKKWRIVCGDHDLTFSSRDEAARAERRCAMDPAHRFPWEIDTPPAAVEPSPVLETKHTFKRQPDGSFDIPIAEKPIVEPSNPELRPSVLVSESPVVLGINTPSFGKPIDFNSVITDTDKNGDSLTIENLISTGRLLPPPSDTPQPIATKLTEQADKLQPAIDAKLADRQTNTPKRMGQAAQARLEGFRLQRTQTVLRRLAALHIAGTCPPDLAAIKIKAQVYDRMRAEVTIVPNGYHTYHAETGNQSTALAADPIAVKLWSLLGDDKPALDPIQSAIEALQFSNIPGYFPTPAAVIDRMLEHADIELGQRILEPSAGSGNIADHFPGCDCIEKHYSLANILRLKGHKVIGDDFLEIEPQPVYDRIIANPPFDRGLDIVHIKRMIEWLAPGGCIIAIAAGGPRQVAELQPIASYWEELPAGSFKQSGTGVSSVLMVINR